jgi:hypothetical protein
MAKLTQEHIEILEKTFAGMALALRERIEIGDYEDEDELAGIEQDIRNLLAVEITDCASAYRAFGVCDDRDTVVCILEEEEELGEEIVEIVYNEVVFKEQA